MSSYWNIKPKRQNVPTASTPGSLMHEEGCHSNQKRNTWAQHRHSYSNGYYSDLQQPLLLSYGPHLQWSQDATYTQEYLKWLEDRRRHPPSPPAPPSTPIQGNVNGNLRYILGARPRVPASTQSEPSPVLYSVWGRTGRPPRFFDFPQAPVWASAPASPVCSLRQALNKDSKPDAEGVPALTQRANVHDLAVNGKKGSDATSPLVSRRRRADSFGELTQPEDLTHRGWPEKSPHTGSLSNYVLAHSREQQWRDQWGHTPGQSLQYYASFFRDREPAYSRSDGEMWEQRERYELEEEVRRKDRLRQIREQAKLGPWHGMTRDEKKNGKNKAKRAMQRARERKRREARRLAGRLEEGEEGRGGVGGEGGTREDEGKEQDVEIQEEGKEEVEQEEDNKDAKQEEEIGGAKQEEEEQEQEEQEEAGRVQEKEEEANKQQENDPNQENPHSKSPPPAPWPPHYCTCFSFLQCAAHRDIPDSCHLCVSFYFAGHWCGMEKGWCNFGPFVEESKVQGWGLKVMREGEGVEEWRVAEWDEGAEEGRGA